MKMKKMLFALMLSGAAAFAGEIGRESVIGKLQIRTITSMEDVTVYALGGNLETAAIQVTAVMFDANNQRIVRTKTVKAYPATQYPVRITIDTDGARVQELRISELALSTTATVQP